MSRDYSEPDERAADALERIATALELIAETMQYPLRVQKHEPGRAFSF